MSIITSVNTMLSFAKSLKRGLRLDYFLLYALGICIMASKPIYLWNTGMNLKGFYLFMIAVLVSALVYLIMACSLGEMVSIVPFSGGCYGYVRCTLGSTLGYLVGMTEASKYILYSCSSCFSVGGIFLVTWEFDHKTWLPVIWLLCYFFAITVSLVGNKVMWWVFGALAVFVLVNDFIFISGSMKNGRETYLESENNKLETGFADFYDILPYAGLLFIGIDDVRTCTSDLSSKVVPWIMILVMCTMILMNTSIVVAARAYVLDPALLLLVTFPNNVGLEITFPQIDRRYVSLFCLPALLGNFLGMVYAGGRQVRSMAGSGLLPSFLATVQQDDAIVVNVVREGNKEERTLSESNSEKEQILKEKEPIVAMVICSIISYILLVICYEELDYTHFLLIILRVGGLQACIESWGAMFAYIVFATRFSSMERGFRSPFGITGAVVVLVYTFILAGSLLQSSSFSTGDNKYVGVAEGIYFVLCIVYYILVVRHRQFFSKEEQDRFMKAYVVNANKKKRRGQSNSRGNSKKSSLRDLWTRISMNIVGLPTANSLQSSLKSRGSDRLNSSVPMLLLGQNKVSPSTDDQHVKQEVRIVP